MYPISEIFGPTVQGEGPQSGTQCYFVRFAGCEFRCNWCDTLYAVSPSCKEWQVTQMTRAQIVKGLLKLPGFAAWVVLTGGNPALFIDDDLLDGLSEYFKIAIETQGFTGFEQVECPEYIGYLVISPKPPSSGMSGRYTSSHFEYWKALIQKRYEVCRLTALKYVAFDDTDLEWIAEVDYQYGQHAERFISVGTPQDVESMTLPRLRDAVLDCTVDIVSRVLKDERFATFRVLPQLHTLLWGRKKGV